MQTIKMGSKEIGLKASPLGLFYYKQEFGSDLMGDLIKMYKNLASTGVDLAKLAEMDTKKVDINKIDVEVIALGLDTVAILKLVWVMAKTNEGPGKSFPGFEKWLDGLDDCDITEPDFIGNVMKEAMDGFFRGAAARAGLAAKQAKPATKKAK